MLDEAIKINLYSDAQLPAIEFSDPDSAGLTDARLVENVLAGDEAAFTEIFERYKKHVTRVVARFFRERTEIEEHVQQTFAKAYFSLDKFRGEQEKSLAAWITRITVNVCYDEFRRRGRHRQSLFTEMTTEENDYVESIIDNKTARHDDKHVAIALADKILSGIDTKDRVALTMVYSGEFSLDEAAKVLGITTSNLKSRLFRCRNHIKKRFSHLFV
jgi:RNA polymerase sigma-70 factor (ECF subfamily)